MYNFKYAAKYKCKFEPTKEQKAKYKRILNPEINTDGIFWVIGILIIVKTILMYG